MSRRGAGALLKPALLILLAAFPPVSFCEGALKLGLGYPYASVKYDLSKLALEARYAASPGISVYAGRVYLDFAGYGDSPEFGGDRLKLFTGLEGGYIKFDTLDIKGAGSEAAVFAGGEYMVTDRLSLLLDFAPTLIALKDGKLADVKVSGIELVANIAMYFRFGGAQPGVPKPAAFGGTGKAAAGSAVRPAKEWLEQLKSPEAAERGKAAFELGKAKAAEAVGPLLDLLDDANDQVCAAAAMALGRIGDKRALQPLIEKLEDEAAQVRLYAAKALGALGGKGAVKPLKDALKDDSEKVRKAAEEALKKLGAE